MSNNLKVSYYSWILSFRAFDNGDQHLDQCVRIEDHGTKEINIIDNGNRKLR